MFGLWSAAAAAPGSIKKLLLEHELNVTRVSQEGEYRTPKSEEGHFSFAFFFL